MALLVTPYPLHGPAAGFGRAGEQIKHEYNTRLGSAAPEGTVRQLRLACPPPGLLGLEFGDQLGRRWAKQH